MTTLPLGGPLPLQPNLAPISASAPIEANQFEIHYSPAENLEQIDVGLLSQATNTIDIAAYVLTDVPVIEELTKAAARGVGVRLYIDGTGRPAGERVAGALEKLLSSDMVEMRVKPPQSAIMHLKGYVVDGKVLRTGSANFSASGLKHQDNDLISLTEPKSVQAFEDKFQVMWEREAQRNLAAIPQ